MAHIGLTLNDNSWWNKHLPPKHVDLSYLKQDIAGTQEVDIDLDEQPIGHIKNVVDTSIVAVSVEANGVSADARRPTLVKHHLYKNRYLYFNEDRLDISIPTSHVLDLYQVQLLSVEAWYKSSGIIGNKSFSVLTADDVFIFGDRVSNEHFQGMVYSAGWIPSNYNDTTFDFNMPRNIAGWNHYAMVFDGVNKTLKWYLNGLLRYTINHTKSSSSAGLRTKTIHIGFRDVNVTNYYKGYVSDVRIWNTVRSDDDIFNNYLKRLKGNEAGLIGYWPI